MTTRIHIVNLGPDRVVAESPNTAPVELYPSDSANFYVYDQQTVTVKEFKFEQKAS